MNKLVLSILLLTSTVIAGNFKNPIENILVSKSNESSLSIQNLSNENIEIEILGNTLNLKPMSGFIYECSSYETFLIGLKNISYNFFEVSCQSKILINESYIITKEGA